ncbi:hypothetical protein LshimejAT787_0703390 [Lyophyllum shimeji]|uniref:Uncharacterized protein n=1 Tax=Lyophyllum shimeji TaxID=47721 RepID=A0A9P3PQP2_LYOSH|nr:hypothetical protein LshimejAT787_0703390 [Lyophyllum shimeji]
MFGLIRRISHSVIPRPDRPWADDPTSNAPAKGKKRRLSSTEPEPDADAEEAAKKKIRGESTVSDTDAGSSSAQVESKAVKEVTQGVKEVDLAATKAAVAPEAVPLPAGEADELDELASRTTPPPEAQTDNEVDDNASSVNEETSGPLVNGTAADATSEHAEESEEASVVSGKEDESVTAPPATQPENKTKIPSETIQDCSAAEE